MSVAGATGNGAAEAYTTSLSGVVLSSVINEIAEAETVATVEGYMCGAVIKGRKRHIVTDTGGLLEHDPKSLN